jgi:fatty-acid desaturase
MVGDPVRAPALAWRIKWRYGGLGMNIGYHRLLTHRSFSAPRWMERSLAILGACCMEESPTVWAAWHRQHHHVADKERDPHSPLASFLWGHIGWLMIKSDDADAGPLKARYAPDLASDPFYAWFLAAEAIVLDRRCALEAGVEQDGLRLHTGHKRAANE